MVPRAPAAPNTFVTTNITMNLLHRPLAVVLALTFPTFAIGQLKTAPGNAAATWPAVITINPKALNILEGRQEPDKRQFHYRSGSFQFVAYAPLTGTVMKEVATDFELMEALFDQMPWGWQPKPKEGAHFRVFLTETMDDFIALGGNDSSSGGSKDDYIFTKFSSLGLKKVGPRYAFDAREKNEGDIIGLTFRQLMGEMRSLTYPWAALGMEELTRKVAYHRGTLRFTNLEKPLKERIAEQMKLGVKVEADQLITALHTPWKDLRGDVVALRRQNYLNGLLLVYYFGFLEGDGRGIPFHDYFRAIAKESLAWRAFRDSEGKSIRPRPQDSGSYPEWALIHQNALLRGRSDAQLRAELVAAFRRINVKLE